MTCEWRRQPGERGWGLCVRGFPLRVPRTLLPSPGGGGSASDEVASRGGVNLPRKKLTPPRRLSLTLGVDPSPSRSGVSHMENVCGRMASRPGLVGCPLRPFALQFCSVLNAIPKLGADDHVYSVPKPWMQTPKTPYAIPLPLQGRVKRARFKRIKYWRAIMLASNCGGRSRHGGASWPPGGQTAANSIVAAPSHSVICRASADRRAAQ